MKKLLRFKSEKFVELTDELNNPFRGWYHIYPFSAEKKPELEELIWCLSSNETCALVIIDIAAYKDRDLDDKAISNIQEIFRFFDGQRKDIFLRVVYDQEGRSMEHEPTLLSRVLRHIEQLEPIIQRFRDRIVFFEGMLVGNWGEMHGSRFLTQKSMPLLSDALARSAAGIVRAVRRPAQWRMLNSAPPREDCMMALYNDAIFGSDTDLGTYAPESCDSEEWKQPWQIERELDFEDRLGAFVPQCGEAVCGEAYEEKHTLESTVQRLQKMHMTSLNSTYDERILNVWRNWTWRGKGVWHGINGYDYIGRHLGYRFCVMAAAASFVESLCDVTLTIRNDGFSGFYQEAEALLVLTDESGDRSEYLTDWDARAWKSGQNQSLSWRISGKKGRLYLLVRRKWDHALIRLANPSTEDGMVPIGVLK